MPLKDMKGVSLGTPGATAADAQNYLAKKQANRSQIVPSTSHNGLSSHRPDQSRLRRDSGASSKDSFNSSLPSEEQRAKAMGLKMKPPAALSTAAVTHLHASHPQLLSSHVKTTSNSSEQSGQKHDRNTFDDTASFSFGDSTIDDDENMTRVFRGLTSLSRQDETPTTRQSVPASRPHPGRGSASINTNFQPGRSQSVPVKDVENTLQSSQYQFLYANSRTHVRSQEPQTAMKDRTAQNIDFDVLQAATDTPSRIRSLPQNHSKLQSLPKSVKFIEQSPVSNMHDLASWDESRAQSPELTLPQDIPIPRRSANQSMDTRQPTLGPQSPQATRAANQKQSEHSDGRGDPHPPPIQHSDTPFLNSGLTNSSAETQTAAVSEGEGRTVEAIVHPNQPGHKRPREDDLDYDADTLIKKDFDDLYNEAFTLDPRTSPSKSSFDSSGLVMNLAQRLENLSQMREDEQEKMFRNQNDDEWAETGTWFISKFQEDLQQLMEARLDRRKISMLYEHEVRKRHKDVERCTSGVAEELIDLKSKGTDLIKTRPGSRTGTPMRERA